MRLPARFWKRFALGLGILVIAGLIVRTWVVGPLIVRLIESRIDARVTIRGWWFNTRSAGVIGLVLHEGKSTDSPIRATAQRIGTDLSLGGMLRGRFSPRKVTLKTPTVTLKLDRKGQLVTPLIIQSARSSSGPLPVLVVEDATVTIQQEGREPMTVTRIGAQSGTRIRTPPSSSFAPRMAPSWGTIRALTDDSTSGRSDRVKSS